jgi:hypothetical protein
MPKRQKKGEGVGQKRKIAAIVVKCCEASGTLKQASQKKQKKRFLK